MKNVAAHPEYQSVPENIQFLTREEHKAAYFGDFHNPTNGYYNPITCETTDFGDGPYVLCETIPLSDPIKMPKVTVSESVEVGSKKEYKTENKTEASRATRLSSSKGIPKASVPKFRTTMKIHRSSNGIKGFLRNAGKFIIEHPVEIVEGVIAVVGTVAKVASLRKSMSNRSSTNNHSDYWPLKGSSSTAVEALDSISDVAEQIERSSLGEHTVRAHGQHYGKNKVWKEKAPYQRGGKKWKIAVYWRYSDRRCFVVSLLYKIGLIPIDPE